MVKQVGLKLGKNDWEQFKTLVAARYRMKKLESFVFNNNIIPVHNAEEVELTFENLRLSEEFLSYIDGQVQSLKDQGVSTSRSALLRDCIRRYINDSPLQAPDETEPILKAVKPGSYYFEKGTRLLLDQWIGHRNRSTRIEDYLVSQNWNNIAKEDLDNMPTESEPIRINFNSAGIDVIDRIISRLPGDTSRSAVLRYVVSKMLADMSGKPFSEAISYSKLEQSIEQYKQVAGSQKVSEMLSQYKTDEEEEEGT